MLLLDDSVAAGPLTLFRDHASPSTFHYLPGTPRIVAEDGDPHLQLIRFRGSSQSGGILSLDAELGLDPGLLSSIGEELSRRFGVEPNLVPVLFSKGSARLALLGFEDTAGADGSVRNMFVEKVLGTCLPSLFGRQRAIFSVRLSPEGTTLLESALRGDGPPVLIVYDLEFSGLRPARGMRARIQYKMAYDYLRTRFTANALYFKTDLDHEAEELSRKGLIEIEDVDYQGVDPAILAKRAEEIRRTLSELMEGLFFRPAAAPTSLATEGATPPNADAYWAAKGRPQVAFLMRELKQDEQVVITYDLSEARVATRRIAPQGAIRPPNGTDIAKLILDVTTDWPPPVSTVRAFTLPDADWSGVLAIEVNLRQGIEVRTLVLSPERREETTNFTAAPIEYNLRVIAATDAEALGKPPDPDGVFQQLSVENLFIDPAQSEAGAKPGLRWGRLTSRQSTRSPGACSSMSNSVCSCWIRRTRSAPWQSGETTSCKCMQISRW